MKNYEWLLILGSSFLNVYIDLELVANEYLQRCKGGSWKKESIEDALKFRNLEHILEAESVGI